MGRKYGILLGEEETPASDYHSLLSPAMTMPGSRECVFSPEPSVDDQALCDRAADLEGLWASCRQDSIRTRLRQSVLFEAHGLNPTAEDRERQIEALLNLQYQQELAEAELNVARDQKLLDNLLEFWDKSVTDKVAVLNAGSSYQWRIARLLPPAGISYYHIEQP